jgi:hypothetical protein
LSQRQRLEIRAITNNAAVLMPKASSQMRRWIGVHEKMRLNLATNGATQTQSSAANVAVECIALAT